MTAMEAIGSFRTVEAEWRVSPTELYVVQRAHAGDGAWSAVFCQGVPPFVVDVGAVDDDGEPEWWESCGDARAACALHHKLMGEGKSAEEAAAEVRLHTAHDIEIELGLAAE